MRLFLSLLLILTVTCVFFHQDVFTDGSLSDTGHKTLRAIWADYENSKSEQKRLQGRVDTYEEERNRYINLANDLIGADNSSVASMHSIAVSALSSSYKDKIASRLGLTAQAVLNLYGSSSLESTIESFISTAHNYDSSAWSVYNNTNRTPEYNTANSAIEAWYENGRAADHYNAHVSPGEYLIATPPPEEPSDIKWPSFSCPDGSCGLSWLLPSSARTAHFAKCGTKDDPYNKTLKGCNEVFYTCNTAETARHKPKDCGLEKWKRTASGWSKIACGSDYRACSQNQQWHATVLGTNQISLCGPASSSNPVASPPPTPTPTDGTPNCPDCTAHCSSPCNGSVSYHACGVHETTVSGDHSLQASCTSTDANGNSCTVTNFYACDNHSHVYPTPPPPPTPTLVLCSACNGTYDPNNASEKSQHTYQTFACGVHSGYPCSNQWTSEHSTEQTCRLCGTTFYSCNNNGPCISDSGTFPKHSRRR